MITIRKSILLQAPLASVFDALTDPEQIVGYYPVQTVTSSREVSGPFVLRGEAAGAPFADYGIIECFDRPLRFRYNYWSDNHGTADLPQNRMTIDYVLRAQGDSTLLSLTHANLLTEGRAAMMSQVWDFLLTRLKCYVENR